MHSQIIQGLLERPFSIPSKYFYDDRGSALFDQICDQPEYYLTRSERALLDQRSDDIAGITGARELIELGAGTARKTRHLIGSLLARSERFRYRPLDISQYALAQAEASLRKEYPDLEIHGIQCDYTETLGELRPTPGSLTVFLGSTIGNFPFQQGVEFLARLRNQLPSGDWFLLGVDLVKDKKILEAAYNDSDGVTARFNKNILQVVNRTIGANFQPEHFDHLAFFNEDESRIEMHLVARRDARVTLGDTGPILDIKAGERIRTEVSRKFTRSSTEELLVEAGFCPCHWFVSPDGYFALALAEVS